MRSVRARTDDASACSQHERLALLEYLLGSDDSRECAERALAWLTGASARRAVCYKIDAEGETLRILVHMGVRPADADQRSGSVSLMPGSPLTELLHARAPRTFTRGALPLPLVALGTRFVGCPLPLSETDPEARIGLLFAGPASPELVQDLTWLSDVLGRKLLRTRTHRTLLEAERRLERERRLLQGVVDAVPDPLLLTDTEGRVLLANSRAESLFVASTGGSEGRHHAVALNNMHLSAALSRRALEQRTPTRRELVLVDPSDGSDLLFELLSAATGDAREGTGVVSVLRNVSDLHRAALENEANWRRLRTAEAEARAERDRLNLIIDSVADPIIVSDPSGNIVMMNAPAERLFTAGDNPIDGEGLRAVRANDARFSSFITNLYFTPSGRNWRGELSLTEPSTGREMPVEAISGKITSDRGEVTGAVTILHDLTEAREKARLYEQLKRASDELEQKVADATAELVRQNELLQRQAVELEQASALKSQFLANMSHEFRTPLNAILGYTSMLLQGVSGELTSGQKRNLTRVDSNGRHLLAIINDILDIAKIESGKMPLHVGEFELAALVTEITSELEPIIARSGLELVFEPPPKLPPVISDRQKVKQIVLNLLSNALKFTPQGSVQVTAEYDSAKRQYTVAVKDTGIGISAEEQARVFEDFRQVDASVTREYGGTGLGLAICRRLARMLDGTITLQSSPGEGSTFTLTLPRRPRRR